MIYAVVLTKRAQKDLKKCPPQIVRKFSVWVGSVQSEGLEATRRYPGFHDETLKGEWTGFRSIRLSRAYRAIYQIQHDGSVEFACVETVNKHKY